MTVD
jgi:hypothetical protein